MKKAYTFALNCGYAENGSLSYTPFTSQLKYASAKAALLDLALFFKEEFNMRHAPKLKGCCRTATLKDDEAKFCPKCGKSLESDEFDADHYMEFVSGVCQADNDTLHSDYIDYDERSRWQSDGFEKAIANGSVRFVYTAEKVMAAAIGHSPDERVTIERIFTERTGQGGKSFSFW